MRDVPLEATDIQVFGEAKCQLPTGYSILGCCSAVINTIPFIELSRKVLYLSFSSSLSEHLDAAIA